jgi:hypothetical protein
MNHKDILSRAWKLLWSYKTLWVFGIILTLTTSTFTDRVFQFGDNTRHIDAGDPGQYPYFLGESFQEGVEEVNEAFDRLFTEVLPEEAERIFITLAILLGCVILLFIILRMFLRYISETAIIKLVDEYEVTGTKRTWREGFRIGWSRTAWKLFLIDLVINLPVFVAFVLIFALILSPLLLWLTASTAAGIFGSVISVGLFVLTIFLALIVAAALSLLNQFFRRTCALEDLGVRQAIIQGYMMVRKNIKDVGLMWLITMGVNIGIGIALIPVALLIVVTAAMLGGLFGLAAGGITSIFASEELAIIVGATVGAPIFFLMVISPLALLGGLKDAFISISWTLTYRELRTLGDLTPTLEEVDSVLADEGGIPEDDIPDPA